MYLEKSFLASARGASEENLASWATTSSKTLQKRFENEHSVKRTGSQTPCFCVLFLPKDLEKCLASAGGASEENLEVLAPFLSQKSPKTGLFGLKSTKKSELFA